ncbi:MAG: hypothetical protein WBW62_01170 [Solirubrobacterales bacterium]
MSVHSDEESAGTDIPGESGTQVPDSSQIEDLQASVATIAAELRSLGENVSALVAAVDALSPGASPERPSSPVKRVPEVVASADTDDSDVVAVTVSPLPELAMAAVAETTLRGLPGVRQVTGVKREGDWARFTLDVSPGTDLIAEMDVSMPVRFKITDNNPGAISLRLQWAWGTS